MKHFKYIIFSLVILSIFTGCGSKNINQNEMPTSQVQQNADDEFLDEFEQEMQVEEKSDPFGGYNRAMTSFNDGAYEYVLSPIAKGYKTVVHEDIRDSIGNFFHNLLYPIRLVNNLLQGKLKNSVEETGRFVINTTIGIFGLFDPAKSYFGLEEHNEDFGQTLGYWGVGPGPHIVLPLLGPSNLRDTLSMYPDSLVNPVDYQSDRGYNLTSNSTETIYVKAFKTVNKTSIDGEQYDIMKKDAVDLYPFLRDVYEQRRVQQIKE
jgi:phospholipid-binding lipoprotein MlaA